MEKQMGQLAILGDEKDDPRLLPQYCRRFT